MRILLGFFALLLLFSCKKDSPPIVPIDPIDQYLHLNNPAPDYSSNVPQGYTLLSSDLQVESNVAQLGRVLFYDKKLSKDGTVSCGTCHQQAFAFADPLPISRGVFGKKGTRNTMALGSFTSLSGFLGLQADGMSHIPLFWDSRTTDVSDQIRQAFEAEQEMGMTMSEVLVAIEAQAYYAPLFEAAFGDSLIIEARVMEALLHFMGAMHNYDSKYDRALAQAGDRMLDFEDFTASENLGKALYMQHCDLCHGSLTTPQLIFEANNGLDSTFTDLGKGAISDKFYDNGIFKVPALRNIALTAPYMHDGRMETLEEVIEHYNSGVIRTFSLHGDLLTHVGGSTYVAKKMHLNQAEKTALKDFLLTLKDEHSIQDERFSDPFK